MPELAETPAPVQMTARVRSPAALIPPLASAMAASAGAGLLQTLLPLRLRASGLDTDAVGLVVTAYALGFVFGCLWAAGLIRSVGHVRTSCVCAAITALSVLGFEWHPGLALSIIVNGLIGLGSAGLYVVTESWLNELAAPEWRGRLLTIYVVLLAVFWALGQSLGLGLNIDGSRMLILSAGFYMLALVPMAAIDVVTPKSPETAQIRLLHAFKVAPVGALACLHTGLVAATFTGIGPLFGEALGLDTHHIVLLMIASQIGMALQWPLGAVSDRMDRRRVMIGMSLLVSGLAMLLVMAAPIAPFYGFAVLFAAFSGVAESFYPIGVAHANDRAQPSEYVLISSNLLLIFAVGRALGPLVGASVLRQAGPAGLLFYAIALSLAFAVIALARILWARSPKEDEREEFVAYPTTSPTALEWVTLRKLRRQQPPEAVDGVAERPSDSGS